LYLGAWSFSAGRIGALEVAKEPFFDNWALGILGLVAPSREPEIEGLSVASNIQ